MILFSIWRQLEESDSKKNFRDCYCALERSTKPDVAILDVPKPVWNGGYNTTGGSLRELKRSKLGLDDRASSLAGVCYPFTLTYDATLPERLSQATLPAYTICADWIQRLIVWVCSKSEALEKLSRALSASVLGVPGPSVPVSTTSLDGSSVHPCCEIAARDPETIRESPDSSILISRPGLSIAS